MFCFPLSCNLWAFQFSDMEFLIKQHGDNSVEVDIGFIPEMELEASRPSRPVFDGDADMRELPLGVSLGDILKFLSSIFHSLSPQNIPFAGCQLKPIKPFKPFF